MLDVFYREQVGPAEFSSATLKTRMNYDATTILCTVKYFSSARAVKPVWLVEFSASNSGSGIPGQPIPNTYLPALDEFLYSGFSVIGHLVRGTEGDLNRELDMASRDGLPEVRASAIRVIERLVIATTLPVDVPGRDHVDALLLQFDVQQGCESLMRLRQDLDKRVGRVAAWVVESELRPSLEHQASRFVKEGSSAPEIQSKGSACLALGELLLAIGESPREAYEHAIEHLNRAVNTLAGTVAPSAEETARIQVELAQASFRMGEWRTAKGEDPSTYLEEALASLDAAVKAEPRLWQAMFLKGKFLQRLGRRTEALAAYEQALSINGGQYPPLKVARDGVVQAPDEKPR